ncbi:hypothetical protein MBANPS3_012421 [Mucor bainieri]
MIKDSNLTPLCEIQVFQRAPIGERRIKKLIEEVARFAFLEYPYELRMMIAKHWAGGEVTGKILPFLGTSRLDFQVWLQVALTYKTSILWVGPNFEGHQWLDASFGRPLQSSGSNTVWLMHQEHYDNPKDVVLEYFFWNLEWTTWLECRSAYLCEEEYAFRSKEEAVQEALERDANSFSYL